MRSEKLSALPLPKRRNRAVEALPDGALAQIAEATAAGAHDVGGMPSVEEAPAAPAPVETVEGKGDQHSARPTCRDSPLRRAQPGVRLAVYIPQDIEAKLRSRAARERVSMSLLVSELLTEHL